MIIAIEGMDASGKASHSKLLAEELKGKVIDFPHYQTPVGQIIKSHLLQKWAACEFDLVDNPDPNALIQQIGFAKENKALDAMVFQCLQTANRLELYQELWDAKMKHETLILDRYWASAIVYGGLDGLDVEWIKKIQAPLPEPDYWFFLDIPAEESVRRRPERRDRYEKQPGLMEKVREAYRQLFSDQANKKMKDREEGHSLGGGAEWHIIDGMGTKQEVHARITRHLPQFWGER